MDIMKKNLKFIAIAFVFFAAISCFKNTHAVSCSLNNVSWGQQSANVGQEINFVTTTAASQDCNGWEVSFQIYETDSLTSNDYITTVKATFGGNSSVVGKYTFTQADYTKGGDESGNETMKIIAVVGSGATESKVGTSSDLILNKSGAAGVCRLYSVEWKTNFNAEPIIGSPLHMVVNGTGCPNYTVSYQVYDDAIGDAHVGNITGKFDTTGTIADTVWKASGRDIKTGEDRKLGTYQFYFIASADKSSKTSNIFAVIVGSEQGCVNCNFPGASWAGTCECADGYKQSAVPVLSTCNNICSSHIGDALSDKVGTGGDGTGGDDGTGGCGTPGQPACQPGETQTYSFSIPNPLKGGASDLASLVKVIAQWIFDLAVPIAVVMIVYAGVLFLTAQGNEQKVTKAKDVLKWAVVGLAIILIGSGFVTLIQSVLELGTPSSSSGQPTLPTTDGTSGTTTTVGAVGNKCSQDRDCFSGLKCKNTICQRTTGNLIGEPCNGGTNCDVGLACGGEESIIIDGQTLLGTCFQTSATGGRIGDTCQRDSECISELKCNQICQRKDGNLNGEACLKTSSPSNCKSKACHTIGTEPKGDCVPYSGT